MSDFALTHSNEIWISVPALMAIVVIKAGTEIQISFE